MFCLFREVIASVVSADKEKYSEAYLGRENQQYCTWILTKDAWGGAIEVQILAEYFQVEIVVVDTKSGWIEQAIIRLQVPIHNSRKFNGVR